MLSRRRPELTLPPELYYTEKEARKYTLNSHIIDVQTRTSHRALELLALPAGQRCTILDIGCGSGLSGEVLSDNDHLWVGIDISPFMLGVALEREVDGHLILGDIGVTLPLRSGCFDGAISVSAIQWLCVSQRASHDPIKRIRCFFSSLFASLSRGARAVLQFYPVSANQTNLLQREAFLAGFTGGVLVDYPHSTKAKKYFLVLDAGDSRQMPMALDDLITAHDSIPLGTCVIPRPIGNRKDQRLVKYSVAWIKHKKKRARSQHRGVANDSRYTGRKRRPRF